ncbi:MAG TPA: protease pro-enzyme activation domain-containing protein [Solirubrobacteraceae bacterium]
MRVAFRVLALVLVLVPATASGTGAATQHQRKITFFFGLKRPEKAAQRAFFAVGQPGSPTYRRFLTASQVAARYGASAATRAAFITAVRKHGLSARIDPSGVFARVSGTPAQFERVLKVKITSQAGNAPNVVTWFVKPGTRPKLPSDIAPLVQDVVTTYAHSATASGRPTRGPRAGPARARKPERTGRWIGGCAQAKATGALSFDQVRRAYGINRLGTGARASVAILNAGESVPAADIAANAKCFGYARLRSRTLLTEGQTHVFSRGTFEPQEDLALVRGTAPGLTSLEFSQVWLSPELWFLGASQVLDGGRLPDTFSISYGECERSIRARGSTPSTRAGANLMDAVLVRLGLAGVGSYAAAGDFGSTCGGRPFSGVTWPASSPFVTAVGGTQLTLTRANQRKAEVVWNDTKFESVNAGAGAGGGGFSGVSPRPPFQRGLGVPGRGRTMPDVAAVGSQFPAWPVVLNGHWETDAGTSAATPLVASAMAIVSATQRGRGRGPLGPADGLFYFLARRVPRSRFDVVAGNNRYLHKVKGHRAKRGYDLASGLGVPRFAQLAAALPPVAH